MDKRDLVSTSEAARYLGVHRRTLARYAELGWLVPALVLPSGHLRWNLLDLDQQLVDVRRRRTGSFPPRWSAGRSRPRSSGQGDA